MRKTGLWVIGALTAALFCTACPTKKQPVQTLPSTDGGVHAEPTGRIDVRCTPAEAVVNVDGNDHGTAAEVAQKGGLVLPHGLHRLEISHPGYRTFRFELILGEKPEKLEVQLQPVK